MVKAKLSINVKTKNTSKHDYCWSFLTYLKYRVSHSGRERAGLGLWRGEWVPNLCSPILLISPCNGLQPPMGATPYILKYALHTTLVNPPISRFPLHAHSMQRGELHQIFAVSPIFSPQKIICNSIQNHWKTVSLLTYLTNLIVVTPRFAPHVYPTVLHNYAQKWEFSVIFII